MTNMLDGNENGNLRLPDRRSLIAGACGFSLASLVPTFARAVTQTFSASGNASGPDHGAWNQLLSSYLKNGSDGVTRVDYRGFKASGHGALKAYIKTLEAASPSAMSRSHQFAYWVNLYNAKTIDVVLDHYPVKSIRDIGLGGGGLFGRGPWSKEIMTVEGTALSLDDIEHKILRPIWRDPRIHYAVNCASVGCPNLMTTAYTASNLTGLLDQGARTYINHPRGVTINKGTVTASKIYDWFKKDFGNRKQLVGHWRTFAEPQLERALAAGAKVRKFTYDWSLNDV